MKKQLFIFYLLINAIPIFTGDTKKIKSILDNKKAQILRTISGSIDNETSFIITLMAKEKLFGSFSGSVILEENGLRNGYPIQKVTIAADYLMIKIKKGEFIVPPATKKDETISFVEDDKK